MQTTESNPKTEKKRVREMRTISQMVALYCAANHPKDERTHAAHCKELVCSECAALDAYAVERTLRCKKMDVKTSCEECENHCYKSDMREKICAIMRFSGPRMITKHPVAAIRHLLKK
ncbi:MAG: nitrous oxide-stimulated promoter family protein [Anaerotardibacter sp.]